jgi:trimethylamine:corrinoid methyltransferase-like protein
MMTGFKRTGLKGGYLHILDEDEVEGIHNGALQVLSRTGIILHDDDALTTLEKAGCQVEREDRHFRNELLTPNLIRHEPRESWQAAGGPDVRSLAREEARRILGEHHPPPLTESVSAKLDAVVNEIESN